MNFIEKIGQLVPETDKQEIDWDSIDLLLKPIGFNELKNVPQDGVYHGEGDVYIHTQMVCKSLLTDTGFFELPLIRKAELFLAALLHDIGKLKTTRQEDGKWTAPHHASVGSRLARDFLWRECSICGSDENIAFRETVCALILYHMLPVYLSDYDKPEMQARKTAALGEMAQDFSWDLLCKLSMADIKGRTAHDMQKMTDRLLLSKMIAVEAGCLKKPYLFADSFTKHAYLSGRNVYPDQSLFNDTWGEVFMMSGLPGTGKDTWINKYLPDLPMVSLDEIRKTIKIKPTDDQGEVISTGYEKAREYLRKKQAFVWNATNLTLDTRSKLVSLFERYGAAVHIVYLETGRDERIKRNISRDLYVPESAVDKLTAKTVLPTPDEAQTVEWIST